MQPADPRVVQEARMTVRWSIALAVSGVVAPAPAWAYVDPGVVGMLYQAIYAVFFGGLMAWLLKPWRYVTKFFARGKPDDDRDRLP